MTLSLSRLRGQIWPAIDDEEGDVAAAPSVPLREIVRRFWPLARPYWRWLLPALLFVALGPALETATIWLYGVLVDDVLVPQNFGLFPRIALAYLGLTILSGLVSFGDDVLTTWVSERFLLDLRTRLFSHLHRLAPDFFEGRRRGDLLTRLVDDADDVDAILISGVAELISYLLRIVFFAGALFFISWRLALLTLLVAPLFALASRVFSSRIRDVSREQRRRDGAISAIAEEGLANLPLVQAYGLQEIELQRFRRESLANATAQLALTRIKALFSPLLDLFELGAVLVVVGAGIWQLAQGALTLGGLLVFLTYLTQLLGPVRGLSQLISSVASASAGAERIIDVLDHPPAIPEQEDPAPLPPIRGSVVFDGVSFAYPGSGRQALDEISFHLEPGSTLAIVGASGAGKSTIARLLLRFYDPDAGAIYLDGHDLRTLDPRALRQQMAVVLQESLVFAGTIRQNIALGRPDASDADIERAAIAADAHRFIQALPEGYETVIGQGGAGLSGGQRQRLAIARAIIRDAPLLILDEPTTGLDAASGERVMTPLRRLMAGRATIVISHNLLTVRDATEIVVLDDGRIVERGTHDELVRRNGDYARLYRLHHPGQAVGASRLAEVA